MSDATSNPNPDKSDSIYEQIKEETRSVAENNVNKPSNYNETPIEHMNSSVNISPNSERNITNILNLGGFENSEVISSPGIVHTQFHNDSSIINVNASVSNKYHRKNLRHKNRHIRKRKWRPLWKLTQKEREKVYELEKERYQREKEELIAAGVAFAPHNTSEFLIDDRGISSYDDEEEYDYDVGTSLKNKEFDELYESVNYQLYDDLSKHQLVQLWIEAEDRNEALEMQINDIKKQKELLGITEDDIDSQMTKIEVFKEEIAKLQIKNAELSRKNERLRKYLNNKE